MLADFHENRRDSQGTLQTINDWALRSMECTEAGILVMGGRRRRGETVVSSDPRVIAAHDLQINMGEGPCLDVLMVDQPRTYVVGDTESDRRFPRWGPEAARLNLRRDRKRAGKGKRAYGRVVRGGRRSSQKKTQTKKKYK